MNFRSLTRGRRESRNADCSWDAHRANVIGKGEARVGKTDAILTGSHLDTGNKICIAPSV